MPFISAGILILEGSRQKTSASVSVDGDQKAIMTDHVVVVVSRSKEDSRKQVSLSGRETCSTSKNVGRVIWRDRGYCNWILKRRP